MWHIVLTSSLCPASGFIEYSSIIQAGFLSSYCLSCLVRSFFLKASQYTIHICNDCDLSVGYTSITLLCSFAMSFVAFFFPVFLDLF